MDTRKLVAGTLPITVTSRTRHGAVRALHIACLIADGLTPYAARKWAAGNLGLRRSYGWLQYMHCLGRLIDEGRTLTVV